VMQQEVLRRGPRVRPCLSLSSRQAGELFLFLGCFFECWAANALPAGRAAGLTRVRSSVPGRSHGATSVDHYGEG